MDNRISVSYTHLSRALYSEDREAAEHIVRRLLYYRGGKGKEEIKERYFFTAAMVEEVMDRLTGKNEAVEDGGIYYHGRLYAKARDRSIKGLRRQSVTQPARNYAALAAGRTVNEKTGEEQLKDVYKRQMQPCVPD